MLNTTYSLYVTLILILMKMYNGIVKNKNNVLLNIWNQLINHLSKLNALV